MNWALSNRAVAIVCRIILAAVFIYAAIGKIISPADFANDIAGYRILPVAFINIFAITLPWVELVCGISMISGLFLRSGGVMLLALNLVFIIAVGSAMARGLNIECGCFTLSSTADTVGWGLIGRDVLFTVLSIPIAFHRPIA